MPSDPYVTLLFIASALIAAAAGVAVLLAATPRPGSVDSVFSDRAEDVEFLFDGTTLVDATPAARALLRHVPLRNGSPWQLLSAWLRIHFPEAPARVEGLADVGRLSLLGRNGDGTAVALVAESRGGLTHLRLRQDDAIEAGGENPLIRKALQDELDRLRACVAAAPLPMWECGEAGEVLWGNRAYLDLAAEALGNGQTLSWPLPGLFDASASPGQRQSVTAVPSSPRWFDVFGPGHDGRRHGFAVPVDSAVQAEASLQTFLQTLTRTFAHLPIGLAIFDSTRRLALFNPALADLTGLAPDFLSSRPSLAGVLDALRERAMLPEPKDYMAWRRTVADLEQAASGGHFEETWNLPGGQTYRVTGRPHPNGGLAFLVEDISLEMSQTRRYRADLELGQAVIDAMDEAVAVFSAAGLLVMSNAAYASLWDHDPTTTLDGDCGIGRVSEHWRSRSAPTSLWDRAEDFIAAAHGRDAWSDTTRLADGRALHCRFSHLAGGATLAAFRILPGPSLAPRTRHRERRAAIGEVAPSGSGAG